MIFNWSQICPEILKHLSDTEARALELHQAMSDTTKPLGAKTLTKYGFKTHVEYRSCLESARRTSQAYLAELNIHSVTDLEFDIRHTTIEGRLARKVCRTSE